MSRRTTLIKQIKASGIKYILLDGGNSLFGSLPRHANRYQYRQAIEKAKVIIASFNHMNYTAMAVGSNEIEMGLSRIKELEKMMKFPFLCANLVDEKTGKPIFTPSTMVTVNGIKIGIFGLVMDTLNSDFLKEAAPGTRVINAFETGKKIAAGLRSKTDMVIGLCHTNYTTNQKLLSKCADIDIIIDPNCMNGNHMIWVSEDKYLEWIAGKPLLRCDGQGSRLGRFDILLGEKGKPFVSWDDLDTVTEKSRKGLKLNDSEKKLLENAKIFNLGTNEMIEIFPHIAEAPEVKALVKQFKATTRFPKIEMSEIEQQARKKYLCAEDCKKCHKRNYENWKKTMHGNAYSTLTRTKDEFRYDCLPCHSLGYGETFINAHKVGPYKNVQCESCHGSNPKHSENPKLYKWPTVKLQKCIICHNSKLLGIPFDFKEMRGKIKSCDVSVKPPKNKTEPVGKQ